MANINISSKANAKTIGEWQDCNTSASCTYDNPIIQLNVQPTSDISWESKVPPPKLPPQYINKALLRDY